jgi:hypothetical protein
MVFMGVANYQKFCKLVENGRGKKRVLYEKAHNRVFCKVRKTQHQNPEFGPNPSEIFF